MTFGETMSQNKKYLYAVGVALVVAATSYCVWNYGLHSAEVPVEGEAFDAFKTSEIQKLADVEIAARKFEEVNTKTITDAMTNNAAAEAKQTDYATKKAAWDVKNNAYQNGSKYFNWVPFYGVSKPGTAPTAPAAYTPVTIPEELTKAHTEAGAEFKEFTQEQLKIFVDAETKSIVDAQTEANKENKFEDALTAKNLEVAENNAKFYNDGRYNIAAGTLLAGAAGYGTLSKMTADEVAAKKAAADKVIADKKAKDAAAAAAAAAAGKTPKVDPVTGKAVAATDVDAKEDDDTDKKTDDPKESEDDKGGLGAWWILIVLAILALAGGAVYFFVFMPKEEDEEFDAEAQVEEEL